MYKKVLKPKELIREVDGKLVEDFIFIAFTEKYVVIKYQRMKKYYIPILPLSKGEKVGHFAVRSARRAEEIHDRTAALTKERLFTKAGFGRSQLPAEV